MYILLSIVIKSNVKDIIGQTSKYKKAFLYLLVCPIMSLTLDLITIDSNMYIGQKSSWFFWAFGHLNWLANVGGNARF